jgi:hypothetical protein
MATTPLEFKPKLAEFLLAEAHGQRSRENAIVTTEEDVEIASGTLLTKTDAGAGTFAMDAGATGNPTSGAIVIGAAANAGRYSIEFTAATKFRVEDPDGVLIGTGTLGSAFNKGGLTFTLTAGATPAVAGDTAGVTVAIGTGKYKEYVADETAGPADAILYNYVPAGEARDVKVVAFVRDCEVNRFALTGLDAAAERRLETRGILVRGTETPMLGTPGETA